jgi:hypothetical protein
MPENFNTYESQSVGCLSKLPNCQTQSPIVPERGTIGETATHRSPMRASSNAKRESLWMASRRGSTFTKSM